MSIDDPPVLSMWDVGVNPKPPILSVAGSDLKQNDKAISNMNDKLFAMTSKTSTTVSIFGFPPEMADAIFEHFVKCGEVAERAHNGGNWMNIRYTTPEGAMNALKNNGRMLLNNYIIGVTLVASSESTTNNEQGGSMKRIQLETSKDNLFKSNNTINRHSGTLDYIPTLFYSALSSSGIITSNKNNNNSNNNNKNISDKQNITKINDGGIVEKIKDAVFGW
ncbi:hypothetical protein BJ944DRAFT_8488 [Cunninghamella echinulata]|nr:hypothetical protein BJ944DRAFT_8488 [Cunninghamella echinulata]